MVEQSLNEALDNAPATAAAPVAITKSTILLSLGTTTTVSDVSDDSNNITSSKGSGSSINPDREGGDHDEERTISILGFGSLMSERSARSTFPTLERFRLVRIPKYRRVFAHPASIFFQRGIANLQTLEMSSLSIEYVSENYPGFVGVVFEVPKDEENHHKITVIDHKESGSTTTIVLPNEAFLKREDEFDIAMGSYFELLEEEDGTVVPAKERKAIICLQSTDQTFIDRWGEEFFYQSYQKYGISTIWNWKPDSGLRPCAVYLRHCYLAAKAMGTICLESFLDDTYLIDRTTTVREYLLKYPQVLEMLPPPELIERYSG